METETIEFTVNALSPVGARIDGLDMSAELSDDVKDALRAAFDEHALLLFRDQDLTKPDLLRIATIFGSISEQGEAPGGMNLVSNVTPRGVGADGMVTLPGGDGELVFHFDHCFQEHPLKGILLYGVKVPPTGGDTLFTDIRQLTRSLPKTLLERLDGLDIRHKSSTRLGQPEANHPVLYPHPRTGERVLFFSKMHAREIIGMPDDESAPLFKTWSTMIENRDIMYRHVWKPKDLVIFDNIALQHSREEFDPQYPRQLQRVQIG